MGGKLNDGEAATFDLVLAAVAGGILANPNTSGALVQIARAGGTSEARKKFAQDVLEYAAAVMDARREFLN